MTVRWYKRPKPRRRVTITAAVLLVLVLFLSFAPTYIALHFIAGTLEDFGIEHEGFESLKINVWKREVWVGSSAFSNR